MHGKRVIASIVTQTLLPRDDQPTGYVAMLVVCRGLRYDADNNNGQLRRKQLQAAVQKCRPNKAKPIAIHVKDTLPRDITTRRLCRFPAVCGWPVSCRRARSCGPSVRARSVNVVVVPGMGRT